MKEVLTKKFWQGVKKTFYEALEEPPADKAPVVPASTEADPKTSSRPEASSSPPEQK